MKISVVICCYSLERLNDVIEAVNSVLSQTLKPHEVIIVVDHTLELYKRLNLIFPPSIKVILNEGRQGASASKSLGAQVSQGDVTVFLDDDATAAKDWLEKLSACYDDQRVMAVGGKAIPRWMGGKRPDWFPEELDWVIGCTHLGPQASTGEARNMIGCTMSFRREAFKTAGYFNDAIARVGKVQGAGEEAEICMRVKRAFPNSLIMNTDEAIIHHKVPSKRTTWKHLAIRSYNEGLYKLIMKDMAAAWFISPLKTENSYLHYLLFQALPKRLRRFHKKENLLQILAMVLSIIAVGAGYLRGKLRVSRILKSHNLDQNTPPISSKE